MDSGKIYTYTENARIFPVTSTTTGSYAGSYYFVAWIRVRYLVELIP